VSETWGPWDSKIDPAERLARLRSLRTIVTAMFGDDRPRPLARALFLAESQDPTDLQVAAIEFERFPALDRRKVLSVYGKVISTKKLMVER
jgi:hypothetical protein